MALGLCTGAGRYQADCVRHLIQVYAKRVPPADAVDQSGWEGFFTIVEALRADIEAVQPGLGASFFDASLAFAARQSFLQSSAVVGAALEGAPPVMTPHLRAAAARALVPRLSPQVGLDQARLLLQEALRQPGTRTTAGLVDLLGIPREQTRWGRLLPGEEALPWVHYNLVSPRAFDEDPDIDTDICLVEAVASECYKHARLLSDALQHPNAKVLWTAYRVLWYFPELDLGPLPASDVDPLVQGRLERLVDLRTQSVTPK